MSFFIHYPSPQYCIFLIIIGKVNDILKVVYSDVMILITLIKNFFS